MTPEQIWSEAKSKILPDEPQRVYDVQTDRWVKPEGEDIARWAVGLTFSRHTPMAGFEEREKWRTEHFPAYREAIEIGKRESELRAA